MNARFQHPRASAFLQLAAVVAVCLLLVACGGGGGGGGSSAPAPTTKPVTLSIGANPASLTAGQSTTLTWSSSNATDCQASGVWSGTIALSGTQLVTPPAAGTYTYTLTCTGSGGSASGSVMLGVSDAVSNVAPVFFDSGPAGASSIINVPFVSVTLCRPGTSICQTIDHVLVDTGSYGLRIIASVLDPSLALPAVTGASSKPAGECAQFVSGFMWGSVNLADMKIAGEKASSLPVQEVDAAFASIPSACSSTGGNFGTLAALGANGVLGIGLFNQDCGSACTTQSANGTYYECSASTCTGSTMPLANQVANPVPLFATDNNGVVLAMPAVPPGGVTMLTGVLIFGIDTQTNNKIGSATVYAANSSGNFTTTYNGVTLRSSFLDSGSNGLFFADATIPNCSAQSGFYCPTAPLTLSAVNTSANGTASGTIDFTIVNLQALASAIRAAPVGGSFGSTRRPRAFDWGMPFFFGRTVFVAINGASTLHGTGPYWAY